MESSVESKIVVFCHFPQNKSGLVIKVHMPVCFQHLHVFQMVTIVKVAAIIIQLNINLLIKFGTKSKNGNKIKTSIEWEKYVYVKGITFKPHKAS